MAVRRQSRECAVQLLFQLDMNPCNDIQAAFKCFWSFGCRGSRVRKFTEQIVNGVLANRTAIDGQIKAAAANWEFHRIGLIEKNVMRMAVYEMLFCPEVPHVVAINEAVDVAKYFSNSEAGRFVNGVLDSIRKKLESERATSRGSK